MTKYLCLITLVLGVFTGIILSSLFDGCGNTVLKIKKSSVAASTTTEKEVARMEARFKVRLDSLQVSNQKLVGSLQLTKVALEKAKKKSLVLQTRVYDLIDRIPTASPNIDTAELLVHCDSLKTRAADLIGSSNQKDSLYEETTTILEQQIKNRDSSILAQAEVYHSLKSSFEKSLAGQQDLNEQNWLLKKQVKQQKLKSKLVAAAALVVSGFVINTIIHR